MTRARGRAWPRRALPDPPARDAAPRRTCRPMTTATAPADEGRRGDVLARSVQGVRAGLCRARPVRREDLVGLPPEHHVERASHELGHLLAQTVIPVLHGPAPMGEPAAWVFLRSARRLHHTIEREKRGHLELAHSLSSPEARLPSEVYGSD